MFAALHLVLRLEGKSPGMNQLVRVLALDLGDAAFRPDIVTHTPGAASEIGDALSRKHQPGVEFCLPCLEASQKHSGSKRRKHGGRHFQSAETFWEGRDEC